MKIVFYDGECGVCNRFVFFLLERDHKDQLNFAPLQGPTAKLLIKAPIDLSTMALADGETIYLRSTGAIRSMASLGGIWKAMLVFFDRSVFFKRSFLRLVCKKPSPHLG